MTPETEKTDRGHRRESWVLKLADAIQGGRLKSLDIKATLIEIEKIRQEWLEEEAMAGKKRTTEPTGVAAEIIRLKNTGMSDKEIAAKVGRTFSLVSATCSYWRKRGIEVLRQRGPKESAPQTASSPLKLPAAPAPAPAHPGAQPVVPRPEWQPPQATSNDLKPPQAPSSGAERFEPIGTKPEAPSADDVLWQWMKDVRKLSDARIAELKQRAVGPDAGAKYDGGVFEIDLGAIKPMVAEPGDPTYGKLIENLGEVKINIAYGGSCTAGKPEDFDYYASVVKEATDAGLKVASGVKMFIQYGSEDVKKYAEQKGYPALFAKAGIEVINPGCGACIGCGPGVSETKEEVTVSAINRNFPGRSGPGKLYLASPLTVAASAFTGRITSYRKGMFKKAG